MEWLVPLVIIGFIILISAVWWLPALIDLINNRQLEKEYDEWRNNIVKQNKPMDAIDFLHKYVRYDFEGVYILHNKTKEMCYVGQSINVIERAKNHLKGKGNGDVYADFKHGDLFEVIIIALEDTECGSLNELERKCIAAYHAYEKGYNKTRGNH